MRLLDVRELKEFVEKKSEKQEEGLEYQIQILTKNTKKNKPLHQLLQNLKRGFR